MKYLFTILITLTLAGSVFAHSPANGDRYGEPFLQEFTVYPNPTTGSLTLSYQAINSNQSLQLKVYNLIGQEMHSETLSPYNGVQKMKLDLTDYPKGIYMVEISNGEKTRIKRVSKI